MRVASSVEGQGRQSVVVAPQTTAAKRHTYHWPEDFLIYSSVLIVVWLSIFYFYLFKFILFLSCLFLID